MKENKNNSTQAGITFIDLLQITFIILKLCGVINWSWIWVLAPLWGGIALVLIILIVIAIIMVINNK